MKTSKNKANDSSWNIRSLTQDLGWTGIGIGIALGTDFFFYILTGRLLEPEAFGVFGVFLAIYYLTLGPLYHALEVVAKKLAAEKNSTPVLLQPALKIGVLFWLGFIAASPLIIKTFNLPVTATMAFSFVFPLGYGLAVLSGTLQGQERFSVYALYEIVSSGVKFLAIGLIILGFGATGAVTAPPLEILAGFVFIYLILQPSKSLESFKNFLLLQRSLIFIIAVYAAFSLDILALKVFMGAKTVGMYNAVATIGKAVFFGSVAVNRAVFPKFVKNPERKFRLLHIALLLIFLGGGFAALFMEIFGTGFIFLAFGAEYASAADFSPLYMIFITIVSGIALLGNYHLSLEDSKLELVLLLPALEVIGLMLFHNSVSQVLSVISLVAFLVFALLYVPILKENLSTYIDRATQ